MSGAAGTSAGASGAGGMGSVPPPDAGNDAFSGLDFVPQCDTEMPSALMSSDTCRYPVPMDLDLASTQVAVLTAGTPTLLDVYYDALGCFLGDGYYLDASVMPQVIVLCPDTCTKLTPESQLVVIEGCSP